jgi:hypothetical protein
MTLEKEYMMTNADFNLRYVDTLLERPALVACIEGAIKGDLRGVDIDAAFKGLSKRETNYFAKLLDRVFKKGLKKKADRLVEEDLRAAPTWVILPKKEEAPEVTQ